MLQSISGIGKDKLDFEGPAKLKMLSEATSADASVNSVVIRGIVRPDWQVKFSFCVNKGGNLFEENGNIPSIFFLIQCSIERRPHEV